MDECISNGRNIVDVKLSSGHHLCYINQTGVLTNVLERGYQRDSSLQFITQSDLTPGIYEGGFKVWECSIDLCEYIDLLEPQIFKDKKVLEVGCGAGLPSMLLLYKGAREVALQDYNEVVINCFTRDNFKANNLCLERCRFYACDWTTLRGKISNEKFDIILTSETIYNKQYYGDLHDLFDAALSTDGIIFLAAKMYYFGVGGDMPTFQEYVRTRGVFDSCVCWSSNSNVSRRIIKLLRHR
ncbi:unnamed protein product [Thelazia callipaeda]|uniref:protein-histidine N-methyltransferase n=1 Tax=Thelazia callipaeda TaxID=103827 RepID=A0A0N5D9W4_THECL|nr:unnamed protein product [Thelazia callipaeda]